MVKNAVGSFGCPVYLLSPEKAHGFLNPTGRGELLPGGRITRGADPFAQIWDLPVNSVAVLLGAFRNRLRSIFELGCVGCRPRHEVSGHRGNQHRDRDGNAHRQR